MPTPIALIDCNNYYVSCERAFDSRLVGVPVLVLSNMASVTSTHCCHGTGDRSLPGWRHDRRDHLPPAHQP